MTLDELLFQVFALKIYYWDQKSAFASAGLPLSGSSHLTSWHSRVGWILFISSPIWPTSEVERLLDYWRTKVKASLRETPVSPRLSTPRLSATFFHRGWHERTDQTDRTGNSWIVTKNADTVDENKLTRPVLHALLFLLRVALPLIITIFFFIYILKNKNTRRWCQGISCRPVNLTFSWKISLIFTISFELFVTFARRLISTIFN